MNFRYTINTIFNFITNKVTSFKFHTKQLEITKSIQGLINRGLVYLKMNELELARKDFKEAVKMNPYNPLSYNYLGVTYLFDDNYDEALKAFEKAVSKAKNFSFKSAPTSKLLGPMQGPK